MPYRIARGPSLRIDSGLGADACSSDLAYLEPEADACFSAVFHFKLLAELLLNLKKGSLDRLPPGEGRNV